MDDTNKYRELFFQETDEYLQTLNDDILELERNPGNAEILDEIFRAAHTLKGMAATMGYETMANLTHSMESVFEIFRKGSSTVNSDVISLVFECLDTLSEIVEDLRAEKDGKKDISHLLEELEKVYKTGGLVEEQEKEVNKKSSSMEFPQISDTDMMIIENAKTKGLNAYQIIVSLVKDCMLKAARAYLVINKLEQKGEIIQSNPSTEDLENGNFDQEFSLILISNEELEVIRENVLNNAEIEKVEIREFEMQQSDIIEEDLEEDIEKSEIDEDSDLEDEEKEKKEQASATSSQHVNQYIRVDLNRLDSFMNLVSELVIYRTRLEDLSNQYKTTEINEPLEHVARITSDLQDLVLKIRMQPVNVVLNRFPRMIRDLSKELGKEIDLEIEGEETELDRTVVSELGEPLVHLIRNAADHGIELPEAREALGKDRKGKIKLSAYQEGNRVAIIVRDDGKGVDPKVIKESAKRKGISTKGLSDKDLIQLIFHPGFSTVKEVTSVSGRGVGMDVVKQKILSLGGNLEVLSEINKGTSFIIRLPLTLSIIQALMVKVGEETFALPLGIIEKVVKVEKEEIMDIHEDEVYMYQNKAVPIIRLNEKLNIKTTGINDHIILVLLGDKYFGLLVDDLLGQQEIVIKKLGSVLKDRKEYLGATILGNGDITLILDISSLCTEDKGDNIE